MESSAVWGMIGVLAGALIGASASIIATFITGWNSRKLQDDADALTRAQNFREFQKDNLLELQEVLSTAIRLINRAHLEDTKLFNIKSSEKHIPLLSEQLDQEILNSNRRMMILVERISDASLRQNINILRDNMVDVLFAKTEEQSKLAIQNASVKFINVMGELGSILRSNY